MPDDPRSFTASVALHGPLILFALLSATTLTALAGGIFPDWAWLLIVPLLAAAPGMVQRRLRTYRWLCLALSLFLGFGLTELIANPAIARWAALLVALSLLLFFNLVLAIRHAARV